MFSQPAFDHLSNDILRLAFLGSLRGQDLTLLGKLVLGHVVRAHVARRSRCDLHRQIFCQLLGAALELHQHADSAHVGVRAHQPVTGQVNESPNRHVLTDLRHELLTHGLETLTADLGCHERLDVRRAGG